jgi:hypothetical protein
MRRLLVLAVVFYVACAATGAAPSLQPVKYGTLTVVVIAAGTAHAGAVVTAGGQTKTTGMSGIVTFTLVLRQQYVVSVIARGYTSWTTSLWFQKTQSVTAPMQPAVAWVRILPGAPMPKGSP